MRDRVFQFFSDYKLPILSGILVGTTYIPFPPWSSLFCLVPLWVFWLRNSGSLKKVFIGGWITQFLLTMIGFNWIAHTLHEFGHAPMPLAFLGLIGFCFFANLHFALGGLAWAGLVRWFQLGRLPQLLLLPLCVAVAERVFPMIFDWHFGYTWYWIGAPIIQTAEIWGFRFISAFTIFFNLSILLLWEWRFDRSALAIFATSLMAFVGLNFWGMKLKELVPQPDRTLSTLIVQANIGNLEKHIAFAGYDGFRQSITNKYLKVSREGLGKFKTEKAKHIDFMLWPETAFPDYIYPEQDNQTPLTTSLMQFLRDNQIALVAGGYGENLKTGQGTNSIFFFDADGSLHSDFYSKTVLLVFGEYFPGVSWFPILRKWFPQLNGFARGPGPSLKQFAEFKLGPQICYEGLFDWFSRDLANLGAQVLVNVTNDSWYGITMQPFQHLYMTLSRAIETRRPIIRSTNTGISTVAKATGEVMQQSPLHQSWNGLYEVGYRENPPATFFMGLGYWITDLLFLLWGGLVAIVRLRFH